MTSTPGTSPLHRLGTAAFVTLLCACSATGTYTAPAPDAPAALVVGEDPSFLAGLDPLSTTSKTWFTKVDDDTLSTSAWSGYPNEVRVPAGQHAVAVGGAVYLRGRAIARGETVFELVFEAGRTYHVSTGLSPDAPGEVVIQMETSDTATSEGR